MLFYLDYVTEKGNPVKVVNLGTKEEAKVQEHQLNHVAALSKPLGTKSIMPMCPVSLSIISSNIPPFSILN